ncbi:MAG TPA: HutD family protein [Steroidobacteraceae bacterium]|nr:HutD family protein [Steroidobacteraceae bacterium]
MNPDFQHLRYDDYVSMPWKNGAGTTREIAREPPLSDEFQWRLSLATIAASSPFSAYPGYRRSVTLVDGAGFRLTVSGQSPVQLSECGASALFAGSATTGCQLINGTSMDLSLMVREPGVIRSVTIERCDSFRSFAAADSALQAFFCLDQGLAFAQGEAIVPLALHDTILPDADAGPCDFTTTRPGSRLLRLLWQTG